MSKTMRIRSKLYMMSVILLPLAVGSLCANLAFVTNQIKWKMTNPPNYRMNILFVAFPSPVIEISLNVRQGKIVLSSFVACEKDQTKYPVDTCEILKKYNSDLLKNNYTINELFKEADCNTFLEENKDWKCSVQYDSQFGYPLEIIYRAPPTILDGTRIIVIQNFHIDD